MKKLVAICAVAAVVLAISGIAKAESATAYVGTVLGTNAFDVQNGGNQLYFNPQPDTDYVWMQNNGSAPGTVSTYTPVSGGPTYNRDGMKTFAATDIAYGQSVSSIKLQFDYYVGTDTTTDNAMANPSINLFLADGLGHYGIWAVTSKGTGYTLTDIPGETNWKRFSLDCTNILDNALVAIYEHNGFINEYGDPYTPINWGQVKDFTIAGFYDYQRTPQGGFEAWNETLWTDITNVGVADTTPNEYGIAVIWGDTVGGMNEDGSGEIGDAANRAYSQAGRLINDYQITVGSTVYDMTFEAGVVPEPATIAVLSLGGLLLRRKK